MTVDSSEVQGQGGEVGDRGLRGEGPERVGQEGKVEEVVIKLIYLRGLLVVDVSGPKDYRISLIVFDVIYVKKVLEKF